MELTQSHIVAGLWIFFWLYWLAASLSVNKMRKREPMGQRLGFLLILAGGCFILIHAGERFGIPNRRFVPPLPWIKWLGIALTAAGIAFAIWARNHIGKYWSASVSLREGHELIRSGPYAHIRHPIYTGILLGIAGTVLWAGTYGALAVLAINVIGLGFKAKKEEALLAGEFGAAFDEHRRRTGFFLPRISA
ncbi:MAG: isoprenylcysteine carboxylmethyltransferase family protein [Candidatus Acidiferrales bacterium]